MNVLLVGNDFHAIYYTRKELVKELVKLHKVYVAIPKNENNKLIEQLGCSIIPLEMSRMGINVFGELKVLYAINGIIKKIKPNVIFTFTIKPNIYVGLLQRKKKLCQIVTITGLGRVFQKETIKKKFVIALYRFAFRNVKRIIFENSEIERIFTDLNIAENRHIIVKGAGVNLKENLMEEYPDDGKGLRIVFVGRIERDKGFCELLEAAKIYEKNNPNLKFIVLGVCEKSFEKEFKKMHIPSNISLEGWQMDVHSYLKSAHAIILPSYHEGMANVLLEAAATGRPILASRIHGCMESFDEGVSGFGFDKADTKDMMRAIDQFTELTNGERENMGKHGRKKMEQEFNRSLVVKIFIDQM